MPPLPPTLPRIQQHARTQPAVSKLARDGCTHCRLTAFKKKKKKEGCRWAWIEKTTTLNTPDEAPTSPARAWEGVNGSAAETTMQQHFQDQGTHTSSSWEGRWITAHWTLEWAEYISLHCFLFTSREVRISYRVRESFRSW